MPSISMLTLFNHIAEHNYAYSHLIEKGEPRNLCLQLVDDFLQVIGLDLATHDLHHLLTNLTDLLVLGVGSLPDLVGALLGEANAEQTQNVAIGGLHVHVGLDHGLWEGDVHVFKTQMRL